jgi:methyl-accepting chemotaxis protein
MDSKDKRISDQIHAIAHANSIILQRNQQIKKLSDTLTVYEENATGIDAVRASLQQERELTVQLNLQLETLKKHTESLQQENDTLKRINLKLQNPSSRPD